MFFLVFIILEKGGHEGARFVDRIDEPGRYLVTKGAVAGPLEVPGQMTRERRKTNSTFKEHCRFMGGEESTLWVEFRTAR